MPVEGTALVVEKVQLTMPKVDTDPLEVRWGFNPVQREKILNARECGIAHVPFSKFFPIKTYQTPAENHTTDWTKEKELLAIVPAGSAQLILEEALGGAGAQNRTNWGLKVDFIGERDAAKMEVISQALLPTLSTIRLICEEFDLSLPIESVCPGSDELDYGTRETCVSCWLMWLNSDACDSYLGIVAEAGMPVVERDPRSGSESRRTVRPLRSELEKARQVVLASYKIGMKTLEGLWKTIADEDEKGKRFDISDLEHGYRKDLHQNKPQDRQIAVMQQFSKTLNLGGGGGNTNDVLEMLARGQNQTNELLARFIMSQNPAAVANSIPFETEAAADSETLSPQQRGAQTRAANQKAKEQGNEPT